MGVNAPNNLGKKQGAESTTLTLANLPVHNHSVPIMISSSKATLNTTAINSAIASPAITVNSATRNILGYNTAAPNTVWFYTISVIALAERTIKKA